MKNDKTLQRLCSDLGVDLHKGMAIARHGRLEGLGENLEARCKQRIKDRLLSVESLFNILMTRIPLHLSYNHDIKKEHLEEIAKAIHDEQKRAYEKEQD